MYYKKTTLVEWETPFDQQQAVFYWIFSRQVGWKAAQMLCWCLLFGVIPDLSPVLRAPRSAMCRSSWRTCWGRWTGRWFPWAGTRSSLWVNSSTSVTSSGPACDRIAIPGDPKQSKPPPSLCVCSGSWEALPGNFAVVDTGEEQNNKNKKSLKISVSRWLARIDTCVHQNDGVLVISRLRSVEMRLGCCYCVTKSIYLSFWLKLR